MKGEMEDIISEGISRGHKVDRISEELEGNLS